MKNIIVTGGNGFIGKAIINELSKNDNIKIFNIDINLENELNLPNVKSYNLDLTTETLQGMFPKDIKIDLVIHLASPIGVANITNHASETFHNAILINTNILSYCKFNDIPLIFASSSEVFGAGDVHTDKNVYKLPSASQTDRGSYALQKILMEYEMKFSQLHSTVVRFFNIVGPGQTTPGMILPTFINQALNNETLIIKENGLRSYCDVNDMVIQMLIIINEHLNTDYKNTFERFRTINIGNPTIDNKLYASEVAELVIDRVTNAGFNTKSEILFDHNYADTSEIPRRFFYQENKYNNEIDNIQLSTTIDNIIKSIQAEKKLQLEIKKEQYNELV